MRIGYYIVRGFILLAGSLPMGFHRAVGKGFGWVLNKVLRYRRNVVMINLARSFPHAKYSELLEIADKFYSHLGRMFTESIWFGASSAKRLRESGFCRIVNPEVFDEVYDGSKGLMLFTSHLGNWELQGGFFNYTSKPLPFTEKEYCVVYKALRSKLWDDVFLKNRSKVLEGTGFEGALESKSAVRYCFEHRGQGKVMVFPTDQSPYRNTSFIHVKDFMHQSTITMTGGAQLACKFGMAVMIESFVRNEDGGYDFSFEKLCDDASKVSIEELMNLYYEKLQAQIEAQPWTYLWTHKRWKNND